MFRSQPCSCSEEFLAVDKRTVAVHVLTFVVTVVDTAVVVTNVIVVDVVCHLLVDCPPAACRSSANWSSPSYELSRRARVVATCVTDKPTCAKVDWTVLLTECVIVISSLLL